VRIETRNAEKVNGQPDRPLIVRVEFTDGNHISLCSTFGDVDKLNTFAEALQVLPDTMHAIAMEKAKTAEALSVRDAAVMRRKESESKLRLLLSGGRIFGRALVAMTENGGCWLQDPIKRDAGFGFYFESLSALWQAFPDLRPVRWENGELLVEPQPYTTPA